MGAVNLLTVSILLLWQEADGKGGRHLVTGVLFRSRPKRHSSSMLRCSHDCSSKKCGKRPFPLALPAKAEPPGCAIAPAGGLPSRPSRCGSASPAPCPALDTGCSSSTARCWRPLAPRAGRRRSLPCWAPRATSTLSPSAGSRSARAPTSSRATCARCAALLLGALWAGTPALSKPGLLHCGDAIQLQRSPLLVPSLTTLFLVLNTQALVACLATAHPVRHAARAAPATQRAAGVAARPADPGGEAACTLLPSLLRLLRWWVRSLDKQRGTGGGNRADLTSLLESATLLVSTLTCLPLPRWQVDEILGGQKSSAAGGDNVLAGVAVRDQFRRMSSQGAGPSGQQEGGSGANNQRPVEGVAPSAPLCLLVNLSLRNLLARVCC